MPFHDIYDMVYCPWWRTKFFFFSMAVVGVLLLCAGIGYYVWRLRRLKKNILPVPEWCVKELKNIEFMALSGTLTDYSYAYVAITRVLREYISYRFGVASVHKTDEEFQRDIANVDLAPADTEVLQELTMRAYRVKFARESVAVSQLFSDIVLVLDLIQKTETQYKNNSKTIKRF